MIRMFFVVSLIGKWGLVLCFSVMDCLEIIVVLLDRLSLSLLVIFSLNEFVVLLYLLIMVVKLFVECGMKMICDCRMFGCMLLLLVRGFLFGVSR